MASKKEYNPKWLKNLKNIWHKKEKSMTTIKELTKTICEKEGKKVEVSVGNVREILGILSDLVFHEEKLCNICRILYNNGKKRNKK